MLGNQKKPKGTYLVVEPTHLKNMATSKWASFPQIFRAKIKSSWNHHPGTPFFSGGDVFDREIESIPTVRFNHPLHPLEKVGKPPRWRDKDAPLNTHWLNHLAIYAMLTNGEYVFLAELRDDSTKKTDKNAVRTPKLLVAPNMTYVKPSNKTQGFSKCFSYTSVFRWMIAIQGWISEMWSGVSSYLILLMIWSFSTHGSWH